MIGWAVAGVLALLLVRQVRLTAHRDAALAEVVGAFIACRDTLVAQAEDAEAPHRGVYVVPPDFIGEGGDADCRA